MITFVESPKGEGLDIKKTVGLYENSLNDHPQRGEYEMTGAREMTRVRVDWVRVDLKQRENAEEKRHFLAALFRCYSRSRS